MDRLLARLERRIGRYAIPNLILYVVGGMAMVWVLSVLRPEFAYRLTLDMNAVRHGEAWRLVTFLFLPPMRSSVVWLMLALYFTWWVGSGLEQHWGSFRFNAYYFVGALGTIAAALIAGGASNTWLNASLLLAFATTFPDETVYVFFILPVRVKWLGWLTAALLVWQLAVGGWATRVAIVVAFGNYLLFFGGHWWEALRQRSVATRQKAKREQFRTSAPVFGERQCAICDAREADGADIRVCSCEKCGGKPRTLCLEHARSH